jgi:hypothetical protein
LLVAGTSHACLLLAHCRYAGAANVKSAAGVPSATSSDTSGIPAAVALAKAADAVVLVVGTDLAWYVRMGHTSRRPSTGTLLVSRRHASTPPYKGGVSFGVILLNIRASWLPLPLQPTF